jgi:hypothetical protein
VPFILIVNVMLSYSQTLELKKLSTGTEVYSSALFEQDDVYGYFYIFNKDKLGKTENLYEYVLLDKNLNKVCNGEFSDKAVYQNINYFYCRYVDNFILINIDECDYTRRYYLMNTRFRILDIKENNLSDVFTLTPELTKKYGFLDKKSKERMIIRFSNSPFGYGVASSLRTYDKQDKISYLPEKYFFTDAQFNPLWSYSYNEHASSKNYESVRAATNISYRNKKDVVAVFKSLLGRDNIKQEIKGNFKNSYIFLEKEGGKQISEIFPFTSTGTGKEKRADLRTNKIFVDRDNDKVTCINTTSQSNDYILDEELIQGFSKVDYSLSEGKELKRDYFVWTQLSDYLNIDKYGYIREKDEPNCYLYLHNVLMKNNGNLVFILEEYKPLIAIPLILFTGVAINDLFFMELDSDLKLIHLQRISKEKKTIRRDGMDTKGSQLSKYGYFDYAGSQDLGNDNYLFYYYNKQKPESGGKKQWILGIISYIDGKFSEQKLPLKSEDGSNMAIIPAKKGYLLVYETFKDKDRSPELRLEKINY